MLTLLSSAAGEYSRTPPASKAAASPDGGEVDQTISCTAQESDVERYQALCRGQERQMWQETLADVRDVEQTLKLTAEERRRLAAAKLLQRVRMYAVAMDDAAFQTKLGGIEALENIIGSERTAQYENSTEAPSEDQVLNDAEKVVAYLAREVFLSAEQQAKLRSAFLAHELSLSAEQQEKLAAQFLMTTSASLPKHSILMICYISRLSRQ